MQNALDRLPAEIGFVCLGAGQGPQCSAARPMPSPLSLAKLAARRLMGPSQGASQPICSPFAAHCIPLAGPYRSRSSGRIALPMPAPGPAEVASDLERG